MVFNIITVNDNRLKYTLCLGQKRMQKKNDSQECMISVRYVWTNRGIDMKALFNQPSCRNAEDYLKAVVVSHVPQAHQMRAKVSQYPNDSR